MTAKCKKFEANIFNKTKCQNCFKAKEEHSAEALEHNKAARKISKCSYLFVAPDNFCFDNPLDRTRRWQRRFFVLYDDGELTYSVDENVGTVPQGVLDMNRCSEVHDAEDRTGHQYSVSIATPERTVYVKGTSKDEITRWADVLSIYLRSNKTRNRRSPASYAKTQPQRNGDVISHQQTKTRVDVTRSPPKSSPEQAPTHARLSKPDQPLTSADPPKRAANGHGAYESLAQDSRRSIEPITYRGIRSLKHKNERGGGVAPHHEPPSPPKPPKREEQSSHEPRARRELHGTQPSPRRRPVSAPFPHSPPSSRRRTTADETSPPPAEPLRIEEESPKPKTLYESLIHPDPPKPKPKNHRYLQLAGIPPVRPVDDVESPTTHDEGSAYRPRSKSSPSLMRRRRSMPEDVAYWNELAAAESDVISHNQQQHAPVPEVQTGKRNGHVHVGSTAPRSSQRRQRPTAPLYESVTSSRLSAQAYSQDPQPNRRHTLHAHEFNGTNKNETDELKMAKQTQNVQHRRSSPIRPSEVIESPNDVITAVDRPPSPPARAISRRHLQNNDLVYMKKGWLLRQDEFDKDWTKHWFVLSGATLKHFKDAQGEDDGDLEGSVNVGTFTSIVEKKTNRNYGFAIERPGGEVIILSAMTSGIRNNWIQAIEKCMEHQQVLDQQRDDKQMTSQAGSSGGAPRRGSEAPSNLYRAASSLDPQERERSMSLSPADQDALDEVERNIRQIHRKSISDHVHQQHKPQHFSKFESGTAFTPPGRTRASPKESAAQRLFGPPRTEALRPVDESVQSGPRRSLRRNTEVISEPMMRDERRRSDLGFRSGPRAPSAKIKEKSRAKSPRSKSPPPAAVVTSPPELKEVKEDSGSNVQSLMEKKWQEVESYAFCEDFLSNENEGHDVIDECDLVSGVEAGGDAALLELLEIEVGSLRLKLALSQDELLRLKERDQSPAGLYQAEDLRKEMEQAAEFYQGQLAEQESKVKMTNLQVVGLKQQLKSEELKAKQREQELDDATKALKDHKEELHQLRSERDKSASGVSQLESRITELEMDICDRQTDVTKRDRQISALETERKDLHKELEAHAAELEEARLNLSAAKKLAETQILEREAALGEATAEAERQGKLVADLEKQLGDMHDAHKRQLRETEAEFFREREEMEREVDRLERKLEQLQMQTQVSGYDNEDLTEILKEKDATIADMEEKVIESKNKLEDVLEELNNEQEINSQLNQSLENSVVENSTLKTDLDKMDKVLDSLKADYDHIVRETQKIKRSEESLQTEADMLKADLEKEEAEMAEIESENERLKNLIQDYRTEVDELKRRGLVSEKENNRLVVELSHHNDSIADFEKKLEEAEQKLVEALGDADNAKKELEGCRASVGNMNDSEKELEEAKRQLKEAQNKLVDSNERLEVELERVKLEHERELEERCRELLDSRHLVDDLKEKLCKVNELQQESLKMTAEKLPQTEELEKRILELEAAASDHARITDLLANREAELKDAHQNLAIAHSAADDQDLKLVALKQKLKLTEDDYKEQVDLLAQRVQDLTSKLSASEKTLRKVNNHRAESESCKDSAAQISLDVLEQRANEIESNLDREVAAVTNQAVETGARERCGLLEKQLDQAEKEIVRLTQELDHMDEDMAELERLKLQEDNLQVQEKLCTEKLAFLSSLMNSKTQNHGHSLKLCRNKVSDLLSVLQNAEPPDSAENFNATIEILREKLEDILQETDLQATQMLSSEKALQNSYAQRLGLEAAMLEELARFVRTRDLWNSPFDCYFRQLRQTEEHLIKLQRLLRFEKDDVCLPDIQDTLLGNAALIAEKISLQSELILNLDENRNKAVPSDGASDVTHVNSQTGISDKALVRKDVCFTLDRVGELLLRKALSGTSPSSPQLTAAASLERLVERRREMEDELQAVCEDRLDDIAAAALLSSLPGNAEAARMRVGDDLAVLVRRSERMTSKSCLGLAEQVDEAVEQLVSLFYSRFEQIEEDNLNDKKLLDADMLNNAMELVADLTALKAYIDAQLLNLEDTLQDLPEYTDSELTDDSTHLDDLANQLEGHATSRNQLANELQSIPEEDESDLVSAYQHRLAQQLARVDTSLFTKSVIRSPRDVSEMLARDALHQAQLVFVVSQLRTQHSRELAAARSMQLSPLESQKVSQLEEEVERLQELVNGASKSSSQDGIEKLLADKDAECDQALQLYQARYERDLELLKDELQEQQLQLNNVANKLSDTEELLRASEQELLEAGDRCERTEAELSSTKSAHAQELTQTREDMTTAVNAVRAKEEELREGEVRRLRAELELAQSKHREELEQLTVSLSGDDKERASQVLLNSKVQQLENNMQNMQADYEQELAVTKAAHRRELARSKDEMLAMLSQFETHKSALDEESVKKRYIKEIDKIKEIYDRGFSSLERSQGKVIRDMRSAHKKELDQLCSEKDQLLAEEAQATQAALDAMKKAHDAELQKERAKFLNAMTKTYSQADVDGLHKQHEDDLILMKKEITELTEELSFKALENVTLKERLEGYIKSLQQSRKKTQDLMARNDELSLQMKHEMEKLNKFVTKTASTAMMSPMKREGEPDDVYDLRVALKVKDAEAKHLAEEALILRQQLHHTTEELEDSMERYQDLFAESESVREQHNDEVRSLQAKLDDSTSGDVASAEPKSESTPNRPVRQLPQVPLGAQRAKKALWRHKQPERARSNPGFSTGMAVNFTLPSREENSTASRAASAGARQADTESNV